jgi:hypothetical protein
MLNNGRNDKIKPLGFDTAALVLTSDLSTEAATNLTQMVKDVASKYYFNDSVALRQLRSRLKTAAKRRTTQTWAREVLAKLNKAPEGALT